MGKIPYVGVLLVVLGGCVSDPLLKCELTLEITRKNLEICDAERMQELVMPCTCENLSNP